MKSRFDPCVRLSVLVIAVLSASSVRFAETGPPPGAGEVEWPTPSARPSIVHRVAVVGSVTFPTRDGSETEKFDLSFERAITAPAPTSGSAPASVELVQGRTWGTFTTTTGAGPAPRRVYESSAEVTGGVLLGLSTARPGDRRPLDDVARSFADRLAAASAAGAKREESGAFEDQTSILLVTPARSAPVKVGTEWTTPAIGAGTSAWLRHVVSAVDAEAISIRSTRATAGVPGAFSLVRRISRKDGWVLDGKLEMEQEEGKGVGRVAATERAVRVAAVPRPASLDASKAPDGWDSDDPAVRTKAATTAGTLWPVGVPTALPLALALDDDDPRVRDAAVRSFQSLLDHALRSAVSAIRALPADLHQDAAPEAIELARTLGRQCTFVDTAVTVRQGSPVAVVAASVLGAEQDMGRDSRDLRRLVALDGAGVPDWLEGMTLTDPDVVDAGAAAVVLALAGRLPPSVDREPPAALVELAKDRRPHVRWLAIRLLERAGSAKPAVLEALRTARSAPVDEWSVAPSFGTSRLHDSADAVADAVDAALARLRGRSFFEIDGAPIDLPRPSVEALVTRALDPKSSWSDGVISRALRAGADPARLSSVVLAAIRTEIGYGRDRRTRTVDGPEHADLIGRLGKAGKPAIELLESVAQSEIDPSERASHPETPVAAAAAAIRVGGHVGPMVGAIVRSIATKWPDGYQFRHVVGEIGARFDAVADLLDGKAKAEIAAAIVTALPTWRRDGMLDGVRMLVRTGVLSKDVATALAAELVPAIGSKAETESLPWLVGRRGCWRVLGSEKEYVGPWTARVEIVEALERMGPAAAPALTVLQAQRDAADPILRALVRRAMRRVVAK